MQAEASGQDEFNTTVRLTLIEDGSEIVRAGRSAVYGGYAWRGRSKGTQAASSDPGGAWNEGREVLWFAPDQATAEGRWFWGQYQEFGFDVQLRRPASGPAVMVPSPTYLRARSRGSRVRIFGDGFPAKVTPADLDFGLGVKVRQIISSSSKEFVAELDVAASANLGNRTVRFQRGTAMSSFTIYDRVDYLKVTPESALAAFGDKTHPQGYQPFTLRPSAIKGAPTENFTPQMIWNSAW